VVQRAATLFDKAVLETATTKLDLPRPLSDKVRDTLASLHAWAAWGCAR
jgi:hypothetical protein